MRNRLRIPVRHPFGATRMRAHNFGCNGTIGDEPEGASYPDQTTVANYPDVYVENPEGGYPVNVREAATANDDNPLDPAWNLAPQKLGQLATDLGMNAELLYEDWQAFSNLDWTEYLANAVAAMATNPVPIYDRRDEASGVITGGGGGGGNGGIGLGVVAIAAVLAFVFLGGRRK